MDKSLRFLVSGKVQGVAFRYYTAKRAQELNLNGHAVNLSDGRVEVVACGSEESLVTLEVWLQHGPSMARVKQVCVEDYHEPVSAGFRTGWG